MKILEIALSPKEAKVGEPVIVKWGKNEWYFGGVLKISGDRLKVQYVDGTTEVLGPDSHHLVYRTKKLGTDKKYSDAEANSLIVVKFSARVKQLEAWMTKAKAAYYNTGKYAKIDGKTVTDSIYDAWEDELRELAPNSEVLKHVGAPVGKKKVKLPYPMGSLDKVKPNTGGLANFIAKNKGPYIVSDKLDAVSIEVVYTDGEIKCYTRGDGITGQDISFLAPHLKLPKLPHMNLAVRGEIILTKQAFKAWENDFQNARNMTSGVTNRKDIHASIEDHRVVVYSVLNPRGQPSKQLANLKTRGFTVVPHKVFPKLSDSILQEYLKSRRAKSLWEIDGIVVDVDYKTQRTSSGNPSHAVAFKDISAENLAETRVLGIEWNASRHGQLKPVALLQPVKLSGVTVKRATCFNARFVVEQGIGPGAIVKITRSGEVIPLILETIKSVKPSLPSKSEFGDYHWNDRKVDIYLTDLKANSKVKLKQITDFFRQLGVKDFAQGLVAKLIADDLNTIGKIIRASINRLQQVEGIQLKTATKIYEGIKAATKDVELPLLMSASGAFGQAFGSRRLASVVKAIPNVLSQVDNPSLESKLHAVEGFSDITVNAFLKGLPRFVKWLSSHPEVSFKQPTKEKIVTKGKLKGQTIVFTGFRDANAEKLITQNAGAIGGEVNSKTTILLVKDLGSTSSKVQKAKDMGVKVMTLPQFLSKFSL